MSDDNTPRPPERLAFHPVVEASDGRVYVSDRPIEIPVIVKRLAPIPP